MAAADMRSAIEPLAEGRSLDGELAAAAMAEIMGGRCSPAQIGAFLMGLRLKGETPGEIAAMARVMREHAVRIAPKVQGPLLDLCGTGGAPLKTFNVSTIAAFVVAGSGVAVAKHGNRSSTGRCGSADLLEALGVELEADPKVAEETIEEIGIGFLFAPRSTRPCGTPPGPAGSSASAPPSTCSVPSPTPPGRTSSSWGCAAPSSWSSSPRCCASSG